MEEASGSCPLFASVFSVKQKIISRGKGRQGWRFKNRRRGEVVI